MSRIDVLNEAFDEIEAAPPAEEEAAAIEAAPEPEAAAALEESAPVAEETAAEKAERVRDEQGRFTKAEAAAKKAAAAPKAEKAPAAPVKPAAAAPVAPVAPVAAPVKAPQSWKPAAREAFAKAPPEVQAEALRREAEVTRVLNETAEARKTVEQVRSTLAPYETIARANGMDAMSYAGSVLQTAAALQMGTPQQRAHVVAQLISAYGVDVEAINAAMQGQPQAAAHAQQPPQDVNRLVEQALEQRFRSAQEQKAASDWQAFVQSGPEFIEDVKNDMAEILELAAKQGRNMTYQQAYDRACKLNEDVVSILDQRKAAESARTKQEAIAKARNAASSVKTQPTAAPAAQPVGRRAALEAAYDERES